MATILVPPCPLWSGHCSISPHIFVYLQRLGVLHMGQRIEDQSDFEKIYKNGDPQLKSAHFPTPLPARAQHCFPYEINQTLRFINMIEILPSFHSLNLFSFFHPPFSSLTLPHCSVGRQCQCVCQAVCWHRGLEDGLHKVRERGSRVSC